MNEPLAPAGAARWRRWAARAGVDVREGELRLALALFSVFLLTTTFQIATKTLRQSAFVESLGAARLPLVYLAVALLSYPVLKLYSGWADRLTVRRLALFSNLAMIAVLAVFWELFDTSWRWVPAAFYVTTSIAYAVLISQFWTLANQALDARQARRLFGFIGTGGLLGGVLGGQAARLATELAPAAGPLAAASFALVGIVALLQISASLRRPPAAPVSAAIGKLEKARGGSAILRSSPHLRWIAGLMVLSVIVAQVVDLQFNWAVESQTEDFAQRTAFYGNFFSIMGLSAVVFQLVLTGRIHRRLGIGFATRVLPASVLVGSLLFLLAAGALPSLLVAAALTLKIGENGLRYSLDQSTRELLFLPVPARLRTQAKAFIDVFLQRGAKGVAALMLLPVTFGWMTAGQTGWFTVGLALLWLAVTFQVQREYVGSFRERLRHRRVDPSVPVDLGDPVTLEILMQSLAGGDREQTLHALEVFASHGRPDLIPSLLLYHDDAGVRLRALSALALSARPDVVPLIEKRLGDEDPDVRAEAIRVLADVHGQDVCEVMLPRLDDADATVRAAAVACLTNHGDEPMRDSARDVLVELVGSPRPDERCEAARAIGAIEEPLFRDPLIGLLEDSEPSVVLAAIEAARQRVARNGHVPHYLPRLVSLLQDRRLKLQARAALIAFGDPIVPALAHFLRDPDEAVWVRRAIPRVLELIGSADAMNALVAALEQTRDLFTRRKIIEALRDGRRHLRVDGSARTRVEAAIEDEARLYLRGLARLHGLRSLGDADCSRALVRWREAASPDLLDRLIGERVDGHVRNVFSLLSVLHGRRDVDAAYRGATAVRRETRAHAIEYLDNLLSGDCRQAVLSVVDDHPVREKLRAAWQRFRIPVASRQSTLNELLAQPDEHDAEGNGLLLAALYSVHSSRVSALFPRVEKLARDTEDPIVEETASWILRRAGAL